LRIIRSGTVVNAPPITAVVSAGNSVITAAARSRLYRAVVNERVDELMNNMSVEVEVPTGSSSPLMSVPATAIRSDTNGQYVFVLDRDTTGQAYRARRLMLTTYGQVGESVYVDGLKATDLVAAAGAFKLYPGVLVKTTTRASVTPAGGER
jgi:membrane fusion protein, multidrug efflux system